ncbi:MAG: glycosyltransferase [Candidatus Delongbacteria bacterium]|nr:glycosyltransferase [Candidatus Delongbacteria bacterium]
MNFLFAGIKNWPIHHEWEHLMAEALRAAGHQVLFLGCEPGSLEACECVDHTTLANHGSHRAFCQDCARFQQGVHARAGFREVSLRGSVQQDAELDARLNGLDDERILRLGVAGFSLEELLTPSIKRWGKSGQPVREIMSGDVLRQHARTILKVEQRFPGIVHREGVECLVVLNGLFGTERTLSEVARGLGLRVINYERGHVRNTLMFSDAGPSCHMEIGHLLPADDAPELESAQAALLDSYLDGRRSNRDSNARFGTGSAGPGRRAGTRAGETRTRIAVFSNVSWDSSICSRPTVFGSYRDWLVAVIELARSHPQWDVVLRVHPGEASLQYDPTADRTADWVATRMPPSNLEVIDADDPTSSWDLAQSADLNLVFCTTLGLELACVGRTVLVCGDVHYAGRGFTREPVSAAAFEESIQDCLQNPLPQAETRRRARHYAWHLYFKAPTPFPWVEEVEYGRPQRLAGPVDMVQLSKDELLRGLLGWFAGERATPPSLNDLLEAPDSCPLPWRFGSRVIRVRGSLAILITAHDRPDSLRRVLEGYRQQSAGSRSFRILVVDDGSPASLESLVKEYQAWLEIDCLRLDVQGGPARARNRGLDLLLQSGSGVGCVFITGDDMIPDRELVARLQESRRGWNDERVALLARVDWHPDLALNRVMKLVSRNGMQFAFERLPARAMLPAAYFYTSGVALDAGFLRRSGLRFREDFPYAAFEDGEFASRAMAQGLILAYDSALKVYHDHAMDYRGFSARQRRVGAAARVWHALNARAFHEVAGNEPQSPPDRRDMRFLERALSELSRLDLSALQGVAGMAGDLAAQLDREQDTLLEQLFRLHYEAGWFERPLFQAGTTVSGRLSIVIPVYNQCELTRACLESIRRQTSGDVEIVVVDNGSTDGTRELLASQPDILVVHHPLNLGFARACNAGVRQASGELVVLLNNDTVVQAGWDLPLRHELADPITGIVGLRLLYPDGTVQHAGVVFNNEGLPWHVFRGLPGLSAPVMRRRELSAVTGACLAMRRELYLNMHGLDENFVNCYEDIDLCLRVRDAGYRIVYNPDGSVLHFEGRSEGRNERIAHSWLVLQERWQGKLPRDEAQVLAQAGLRLDRDPRTGAVRYLPLDPSPEETGREASWLLENERHEDARKLLRWAINQYPNQLDLRRQLIQLESALGNKAQAERLAAGILNLAPATEHTSLTSPGVSS